jgi:hypothetical protein
MVEVDERTLGPDGALKLCAAHELTMALQEMLEGTGGLRPKPQATPLTDELPGCTVELDYIDAMTKPIARHPEPPGPAWQGARPRSGCAQVSRKSSGVPAELLKFHQRFSGRPGRAPKTS